MISIIGLGNPGFKYEKTRHNIGFIALDYIFKALSSTKFLPKYSGLISYGTIEDKNFNLFKPLTFMNLSGKAVYQLKKDANLENKNIVVLYDDVDLPLGTLRIRAKGSSGGHNGIKSLIESIGEDFIRFRIGIGKPSIDSKDYVLENFKKSELEQISNILPHISNALELIIKGKNLEEVMNAYNRSL